MTPSSRHDPSLFHRAAPRGGALLASVLLALAACSGGGKGGAGETEGGNADGIDSLTGSADGSGDGGDSASGGGGSSGPRFDTPTGDDDTGGQGMDCDRTLTAIVRDFPDSHPDMEGETGVDPGIVEDQLGPDGLPAYAGPTPTTTDQAAFDLWYRTTPNENVELERDIALLEMTPGVFSFDDGEFFPIDGDGLGNEGREHNYHFTLELRTEFIYEGGEVFTFRGDDDLFVFINEQLALDLGGVHGPLEGTIDLDAQAADLGISPGQKYSLDFFFAERHTTQSNFRIETTIQCLETPIG